VSAVKPTPTTNVITTPTGLQIAYPQIEFYKSGNVTLMFFVHNSSGFAMTNTTSSCRMHYYNNLGVELLDDVNLSADDTDADFVYVLNNTSLTLPGQYIFYTYCNSSTEAGFVKGLIYFSKDGGDNTIKDSTSGLSVLIFFLTITILLYVVPSFMRFSENKYWNLIIGRCLAIIATYLLVLDAGVVANIASAGGLVISAELSQIIFLVGTFGYVLIFALFLKTLFDAVSIRNADSKSKRMGGDDEGGDD
jgi:hypothetical protein